MKQARWAKDGVELVDVDPEVLLPGWARLKVVACGICGSDLHTLRNHMMRFPGASPGHEMVGHPLEGPAGLADVLYAIEPRSWCGACEFCVQGDRHLCSSGQLLGVTAPGGLAEFVDRTPDLRVACTQAFDFPAMMQDSRMIAAAETATDLMQALGR